MLENKISNKLQESLMNLFKKFNKSGNLNDEPKKIKNEKLD